MTKRELYKKLFPDRIAINSNKHYKKVTKPYMENMLKNKNKNEAVFSELGLGQDLVLNEPLFIEEENERGNNE